MHLDSEKNLLVSQEMSLDILKSAYCERLIHGGSAYIFPTLASTMDTAVQFVKIGACEGTWIIAERQTHGRGRRGRSWISLPGNFHGSLILRLSYALKDVMSLSIKIGQALMKTCSQFLPAELLSFKSPNDILLSGKKIAGVLIEIQSGCKPFYPKGGKEKRARKTDPMRPRYEDILPFRAPSSSPDTYIAICGIGVNLGAQAYLSQIQKAKQPVISMASHLLSSPTILIFLQAFNGFLRQMIPEIF